MSELPSGTVTFLFTDVEDSTRLLSDLGSERYETLLSSYSRVLRDLLERAGGNEIDRHGDSFFVAFPSAGTAVSAAIAAQRALTEQEWPEQVELRVRMGLHTGEAMLGSDGYVGFAVHKAARIGDAGHGGQVLLSAVTARLIEQDLPEGVSLRDLGQNKLQSLDRPERIFQLVIDGLQDRFPPLAARVKRQASEDTPLLEREAELAAIQGLLSAANGGAGRLVAIEGRPGIGKTRLVAEARGLASGAEFDVLSARGGELEREFAWGVVRQLFEPLLAAASEEVRAELLSGAAELAASLVDTSSLSDGIEPTTDASFALLHGLYWLAANAALRHPIVLAIDDLHWCDAPSLRWLVYLARRLEGLPLLVVVGLRPPETSREAALLTELLADPDIVLVRPSTLGVESVTRLARELLKAEPHAEFAVACHAATGGNPLYVRALLESLAAEGVRPTRDQAQLVYEIGPEAVTRAVALRLGRLPAEANALARATAILGDGSELAHAATLAGLERDAAVHAATTLLRADVLRTQDPLEFVHPVVRASVYESIPPAERTERHRRAADLLAELEAEPEQVAAHLLAGPPGGDAFVVEQLRAAARRARERGSPDTAIAYLRRALEEPPRQSERAEVLRELGDAESLVDAAAAAEHLGVALELFEDPTAAAEIALDYGRALLRDLHHAAAADAFRLGLERLGDERSDLRECLEAELIGTGWFELELMPMTMELLPGVREDQLLGGLGSDLLLSAIGYQEARLGLDRERAVDFSRRALASGRLRTSGARALYYSGVTLMIADCFDEAQGVYDAATTEARQRGDLIVAAAVLLFRGALSHNRGDLRRAEEDLRESIEIATFQGATPYHAGFFGQTLLELGELDEARATLERTGLPKRVPANPHLIFYLQARGRLALAERRFEEALEDLVMLGEHMDAFLITNPALVSWRAPAVEALAALGRDQEARDLAGEEVKRAQRWGSPRSVGIALRAQGLAEAGESGISALRQAVSVLESSGAELERAHALVALGAALRRANSRTEARDLLQQGLEIAHRAGARPLADRAQEELAATGARPRRLVVSGLDALTPSERRVAEMAAQGLTNKEIAQALFVTPKTVEVHLSSVYRKLEIGSRAQLPNALDTPPEAAAEPVPA